MTNDELNDIIKNGENSIIEFNSSDDSINNLADEMIGFANSLGGKILIGINDNGEIRGCPANQKYEEKIVNAARNNCIPPIIPKIEKFIFDNKIIYIVEVFSDSQPICNNKRIYFIRVGSTKQKPTQFELLRLFQKKNLLNFDEMPVLNASLNSLDLIKINKYFELLSQSEINIENEELLKNELINSSILLNEKNNYYPTIAGLLCFGKLPEKYYPSYMITCGAYNGISFDSETISEKNLNGTLPELIEDAISFVKLVNSEKNILLNDSPNIKQYRFSIEVFREAIVNAVAHRDYTITGSSIRLFVFSDRIEIFSPGGLPNTMTLNNIKYRQYSRNQTIVSYLTGFGYMERRGKGIIRMINISKKNNLPEPIFEVIPDNSEFKVTLYFS